MSPTLRDPSVPGAPAAPGNVAEVRDLEQGLRKGHECRKDCEFPLTHTFAQGVLSRGLYGN